MAAIDARLKEAVAQYVKSEAWDQDGRQTLLKAIVEVLNEKKEQLIQMVVELQDVLTDKSNPTGRKHAVRLIADCLASSESKLKLNFQHIETFTAFFSSKLGDWQCVEGAIAGLLAIFQQNGSLLRSLTDENGTPLATGIAGNLLKEVHTPSHTQAVRNGVLILISLLITEWRSEVETLGEALGDGIIASIEEERDPRNLVLAFRLAEKLLQDCSPSCVSEKGLETLFEALTSYFPITFTPPKEDKFGITGDDLRAGLARALSASTRLAEYVVPFFIDASKDVTVSVGDDSEAPIDQALELNAACLERYGPEIARQNLKDILKTAQDQVCRTTTPFPAEFADFVRKSLAVASRDVIIGLHPAWLRKLVDPVLTILAQDAARGESSLASSGSRRLLLAAAAAHPMLLEHTWSLVSGLLLPKPQTEGASAPVLELSSLPFVLNFARLAEGKDGPLLRPMQLKAVLAASITALSSLEPGGTLSPSDDGETRSIFSVAVELVGRLCQLIGEEGSTDGFVALRLALLPPLTAESGSLVAWSSGWRSELHSETSDSSQVAALVAAVVAVVGTQPARAGDLAPALITAAASPQLPSKLPELLAVTTFSLARCASGETADVEGACDSAKRLVGCIASLMQRPEVASDMSLALADAFEGVVVTKASAEALSWIASQLSAAMKLPAELQRLCEHLRDSSSGKILPHSLSARATAVRRLVRSLASKLPPEEATSLRKQVLELSSVAKGDARIIITLVPAALPEAASCDWSLCQAVLPALQACRKSRCHVLVSSGRCIVETRRFCITSSIIS
jgi:hypothetical protein